MSRPRLGKHAARRGGTKPYFVQFVGDLHEKQPGAVQLRRFVL